MDQYNHSTSALLFAMLLILGACQSEGGSPNHDRNSSKPSKTDSTASAIFASCRNESDSDPFQCLKLKCERAGAQFDSHQNTCRCENNQAFNAWEDGRCELGLVSKNSLESDPNANYLSNETLDVFPQVLTSSPGRQRQVLQSMLDAKTELSQLAPLLQPNAVTLFIGEGDLSHIDRNTRLALAEEPRILLPGSRAFSSASRFFYVRNLQELKSLFISSQGMIHFPNNSFPSNPSPMIAKVFNQLQKLDNKFPSGENLISFSDDACSGYCELVSETQDSEIRIRRVRALAGGRFFTDTLRFYTIVDPDFSFARVDLFPSGRPSLVHLYERKEEGEQTYTEWTIHNVSQQLLYREKIYSPIHTIGEWKQALGRMSTPNSFSASAIVCESGFSPASLSRIGQGQFASGPLRSEELLQSESLFGWVASAIKARSLSEFINPFHLSGAAPLLENGLGVSGADYEKHSEIVATLIAGARRKVGLVPVGLSTCIEHGERWIPSVLSSSRARVVNISATTDYEPIACEKSPLGKQIKAQEGTLLYVAAAGNEGIDADQSPAPLCPQNLSGAPNLIIVASGASESIQAQSNRGVHLADIVASGSHPLGYPQTYATSYAAPKVTNAAAQLSADFPSLSPSQIRSLLLLSARIPYSYDQDYTPLPVRSGGTLDLDQAHSLADRFIHSPGISTDALLQNAYCSPYEGYCPAARVHLDLARRHGFKMEGNER